MSSHSENASKFVANDERMHWHDQALWFVREKRDRASKSIPEWEQLREFANQIKTHTMANLDTYLLEFEKNATKKGIKVHFAFDALEHNQIVAKILKEKGVTKLVKSKSMLTEECHLNPYLENLGIEVIDTDLGERIVQLRNEPPSHIVLPAIHLKKSDVSDTFVEHLGTEKGNYDPTYLTRAARAALREDFLTAQAGLTGVNFAIAQTGGVEFVQMKEMQIWEQVFQNFILHQWVLKRLFQDLKIYLCLQDYLHEVQRVNQSHLILHTFMHQLKVEKCILLL